MDRHCRAVFALVAVVVSCCIHVQALSGAPVPLSTIYSMHRTQDSARVSLRLEGRSASSPSLAFVLQTDLANCTSWTNATYTGETLQASSWHDGKALEVTVRRKESSPIAGRLAGSPVLLQMAWRLLREESLKITTPWTTISLTGGSEGEGGGRWWRLRAVDFDVDGEAPSGDSSPPDPDEGGGDAERGMLLRTFPIAEGVYGWGLSLDALLQGDRERLFTFTFTALHEGSWRASLHIPLLAVAVECESVWKSEGKQNWQVAVEVKSSTSDATLRLVHWEMQEQDEETRKHTDDNSEAGGVCRPEDTGNSDVCHSSGNVLKAEAMKQEGREESHLDESSKGGENAEFESLPSGATHEIRQSIASSVLNCSSNMTTYPSPDGGRSIRILQRSHLAFCPRLSWTLNQVFWFRPDWSGWEYVVMGWDWGGMVVRGEWGISLLQWYQKIFAFDFDKGAPLPSTHVVLDFRDGKSYKVWLRWPVLASALKISVTVDHRRYVLLVEEVDEFLGEGAAVELVRVESEFSPAGLTVTSSFSASRIRELHTAAGLVLAKERREACGEVPDHATFYGFLGRLMGLPPARLWERLLLEGRRLLLGSDSQTIFHRLWEVLEEEIKAATGGSEDVWELAWAALQKAGVVQISGEERLKAFIPAEWLGMAQRVFARAGVASSGRCAGSDLLECLLEEVGGCLLGRGCHYHTRP